MMKVDIVVDIRYSFQEGVPTCIFTNARTDNDTLDDILSTWIRGQIGRGEDPSPPVERDIYTVKLGLSLDDDTFCTESNTGNKGLTCGIVMGVLGDLKTIPIKTLAERPEAP
jgi:hypothetical protein